MDSRDHQCPNCSHIHPVPKPYWDRAVCCPECGEDLTADETTIPLSPHQRQMEVERVLRSITPPEEPTLAAPVADDHKYGPPLDGILLIKLSVAASIFGGLIIFFAEGSVAVVFGYIVLCISTPIYWAGITRWAVSHLQRQNEEIIELLKTIAHKDRK